MIRPTPIFVAPLLLFSNLALGAPGVPQQLRQELDNLLLRYTEQHPDVRRIRRSIEKLEHSDLDGQEDGQPNSEPVVRGTAAASVVDRSSGPYFRFEKRGQLIRRPANLVDPGPYWPTVVRMHDVVGFPYDYAMYFSTDHAARGGIWLYVCSGVPTDPACWKSYDRAVADGDFDYLAIKPQANPIFIDAVQGRQTETPHAHVIDNTVYMTYHNYRAGNSQSTLLATSPDGVNFARINGDSDSVILDYYPRTAPGDGHTGYFRWGRNPFSALGYKYIGYSLHGGGGSSNYHAMWGSDDAINWSKVDLLSTAQKNAVPGQSSRFAWFQIDPASIRQLNANEYIAITSILSLSPSGEPTTRGIYEIFLSDKGNSLTRPSRKILYPAEVGARGDGFYQPALMVIDDTWYMIYLVRTKKQNSIHGAEGRIQIEMTTR